MQAVPEQVLQIKTQLESARNEYEIYKDKLKKSKKLIRELEIELENTFYNIKWSTL